MRSLNSRDIRLSKLFDYALGENFLKPFKIEEDYERAAYNHFIEENQIWFYKVNIKDKKFTLISFQFEPWPN